jgi:hypothetical protein
MSAGVLTALELAMIAGAVGGLKFANTVAAVLTTVLLIASLWLLRMGHRLSRDAQPTRARNMEKQR